VSAYKELWLKAVEVISNAERERIIKLLEEQIARLQKQIDEADPDQLFDIEYWQGDINIISMSIALIKGENK
jgi:hypothetical protein